MTPTATPAAQLDLALLLHRLQRLSERADGLLLAPANHHNDNRDL